MANDIRGLHLPAHTKLNYFLCAAFGFLLIGAPPFGCTNADKLATESKLATLEGKTQAVYNATTQPIVQDGAQIIPQGPSLLLIGQNVLGGIILLERLASVIVANLPDKKSGDTAPPVSNNSAGSLPKG